MTRRRSFFESLGGWVRQEICGRGLVKDKDRQDHEVFQGKNVGLDLRKENTEFLLVERVWARGKDIVSVSMTK